MNLFERIKNKRYDLQERTGDFSDKQQADNIRMLNKMFGSQDKSKKTASNVKKNRFFTDKSDSDTLKTKSTGDEGSFRRNASRNTVNREIKKTIPGKSKPVTVGALDKRDASIKKLDDIIIKPKPGDVEKTKTLIKKERKKVIRNITSPKQGEKREARKIIKKIDTTAQDYTNKINQERKLKVKAADKAKQFKQSFGKPTGASPYTGKPTYMKPGVVTGEPRKATKSDGRRSKKTVAQLKKEVDLKDLQKASNYKAASIARSKELKDLTKKMGEKELYQKVTQQAKLKQMRPQRKIYKRLVNIGQSTTKAFGGPKAKLSPVAKKFAKAVAAAPAPVKVASVAALPLLSPTVRKTVKNVALAGLGAAGFVAAKKKPPKPKSFDIGINLSSGKGSSEPSKYALKRQELLKTNPKKVPNKNLA